GKSGVVLGVLIASFGVTGYSLPWDQIGYWAVKIVTGVPDAIPVIGSLLVELLRGRLEGNHFLDHGSLRTWSLSLDNRACLTSVFGTEGKVFHSIWGLILKARMGIEYFLSGKSGLVKG
ncbi:hypothetical protein F8388_002371, partial [Cannabis sativa]